MMRSLYLNVSYLRTRRLLSVLISQKHRPTRLVGFLPCNLSLKFVVTVTIYYNYINMPIKVEIQSIEPLSALCGVCVACGCAMCRTGREVCTYARRLEAYQTTSYVQ